MTDPVSDLVIRPEPFTSPTARALTAAVNEVYRQRYGGVDETPIEDDEFDPAAGGGFLVGLLAGEPVACVGFRRAEPPAAPGTAEMKRMYVAESARRRGFGRRLLAALEDAVRAAGYTDLVLDTGTEQPEAIALYESSGYTRIPNYSIYQDSPLNRAYAKHLDTVAGWQTSPARPSSSPPA
ncbi:GNAT family N-acetyltransferase [Spongisporangium articulatum]|uniref:GNAT family N-acetyltransferase n=1 Tax=Spongisporangium articulatum TaxID=3362603 RepID=A0ABW8ASC0_9ACTN